MATIFICDDEADMLRYLDKLLRAGGYRVETFQRGSELLARLAVVGGAGCDVILQDVRMPDMDGLEVLKQVRGQCPGLAVVIMTAHGTVDDAVSAIKQGAYDYIMKPFPREKLLGVLERLLDHRRLAEENRQLREELQRGVAGGGDAIVFRSAAFREVYDLTLQVAESEANILIMGESGTGKELIASALHRNSPRRGKPFVSLNCAALSDTLLESQLFGHVRGAFTGAVINQKGLLEEADGGTLFLDEIGDVSPAVQAKLLRVTQEKDFIVLGSTRPRKVDVRFVAATNKDLMAEVRAGRFREDLYYRLNVIPVLVPPLRERREDIPLLVENILKRLRRRGLDRVRSVSPEAMRCLMEYPWPGNIRELENVLERGAVCARGPLLSAADLPDEVREPCRIRPAEEASPAGRETSGVRKDAPHAPAGEDSPGERELLLRILEEHRWNKGAAAGSLGIDRSTLWRKMKRLGIA